MSRAAASTSASLREVELRQLESALTREAELLARALVKTRAQLVLAESCTGGMVAAALTRVPGISKHLCGSSVVYQTETKSQWLKIPRRDIRRFGTESLEMTQLLASAVLERTSQATVAAAVTGDLGPQGNVGTIFMACEIRKPFSLAVADRVELISFRSSPARTLCGKSRRLALQLLASHHLIAMVRQLLVDTLR
jgi:nicotinamide-nucleotide amidase